MINGIQFILGKIPTSATALFSITYFTLIDLGKYPSETIFLVARSKLTHSFKIKSTTSQLMPQSRERKGQSSHRNVQQFIGFSDQNILQFWAASELLTKLFYLYLEMFSFLRKSHFECKVPTSATALFSITYFKLITFGNHFPCCKI